ncbi:MAG: PEP-CTERM sorting domain-containing protein [Candidatus Paceibacterota bacterium]
MKNTFFVLCLLIFSGLALAGPVITSYGGENFLNKMTEEEELRSFLKNFSIEDHFGVFYFITVPLDGVEIDDQGMDFQLVGQILTNIAMQNVSLDLMTGYRVEGIYYSGQKEVNWNRKKNMVITLTKIREEYYPPPIPPPGPDPDPGPGPNPDPDPSPDPAPIPEPATFLLIGGGLLATALFSRNKNRV